jgi:hypothetical protein
MTKNVQKGMQHVQKCQKAVKYVFIIPATLVETSIQLLWFTWSVHNFGGHHIHLKFVFNFRQIHLKFL